MPGLFDNQSIDIPCPKCRKKHTKAIGWLKSNSHLACSCGANIRLDTDGLFGKLKKVEYELASMPRKITIKF